MLEAKILKCLTLSPQSFILHVAKQMHLGRRWMCSTKSKNVCLELGTWNKGKSSRMISRFFKTSCSV
uniref:Uncharacterized protein n=1 Tax=Rhizophora mucronata TaxID=61149 RepID=A0A2P2PV17_RHIMU